MWWIKLSFVKTVILLAGMERISIGGFDLILRGFEREREERGKRAKGKKRKWR